MGVVLMSWAVLIAAVIAVYVSGCMIIDALCDMLKPPRW